jgi:hypothetical protein
MGRIPISLHVDEAGDQYPVATPSLGRIVLYRSKNGDGVLSPAIVLRTRSTTIAKIAERWAGAETAPFSGVGRPSSFIAELPDDLTLDLLVHGLGGDYREYAIPFASTSDPGTWCWPHPGPRGL